MNAVEEIQAAIDKLTALKTGTVALPWEMDSKYIRSDGWILAQVMKAGNETTGQLIVTLHATLDAQLEVLETVLAAKDIEQEWRLLVYTEAALSLARAINGTTS